jgi:glycosyltransferase involved in cell wall biosynthesis
MPHVSILLPVFNGARYLREAIDSVFAQTYRDYELLVIDDGSEDDSIDIALSYGDPRLRIERNERNVGLIETLNRGIASVSGEFVARLDADDVCMPDRLAVQVDYLNSHAEVGICGSWYRLLGTRFPRTVRLPSTPDDVEAWLFAHSPIAHPTVMFRRSVFDSLHLRYDRDYVHAEDYDLWVRAATVTRLANIARPLLRYRVHPEQVTSVHWSVQRETSDRIRLRQLKRLIPVSDGEEQRLHLQTISTDFPRTPAALGRIEAWLMRLVGRNQKMRVFPIGGFELLMGAIWQNACLACLPAVWAPGRYFRSPLCGIGSNRVAAFAAFCGRGATRQMFRAPSRPSVSA